MIPAQPHLHVLQYATAQLDEDTHALNVYRVIGWEPRNEHGESEPLLVRTMLATWYTGDDMPEDTRAPFWSYGQPDTCAQIDSGERWDGINTIFFTPEGGSMPALIAAVNELVPYLDGEIPTIAPKAPRQ